MKYNTFIFDFDYTLADATDGIVKSMNYALQKLGFEKREREAIRKTVGMALVDAFALLSGCQDEEKTRQFLAEYRVMADQVMTKKTVFFNDTIDILKKLKENHFKIGIASSKPRFRIEDVFIKLSYMDLVDYIVGIEDVRNPKPNPDGLLFAMDKLGAKKEQVLYVGDSIIDAKTAQNAQIDFGGVTTGTTKENELLEFPCVAIGENLKDLFSKVGLV